MEFVLVAGNADVGEEMAVVCGVDDFDLAMVTMLMSEVDNVVVDVIRKLKIMLLVNKHKNEKNREDVIKNGTLFILSDVQMFHAILYLLLLSSSLALAL